MKFGFFMVLFLVLSSCIGFSYIMPDYYKGITVKRYDSQIDLEACIETFDKIPEKYYEGLDYIKVWWYPGFLRYIAFYHWVNGIDLYYGCEEEWIIHELAHHCQTQRGDNLYEVANHKGLFYECLDEIEKASDVYFRRYGELI